MQKLPKIVFVFDFAGTASDLQNEAARIRNQLENIASKVRAAGIISKLKVHRRGDGRWEFYPKMVIDADLDGTEDLANYRAKLRDAVMNAMQRLGCQNIEIMQVS